VSPATGLFWVVISQLFLNRTAELPVGVAPFLSWGCAVTAAVNVRSLALVQLPTASPSLRTSRSPAFQTSTGVAPPADGGHAQRRVRKSKDGKTNRSLKIEEAALIAWNVGDRRKFKIITAKSYVFMLILKNMPKVRGNGTPQMDLPIKKMAGA